MFSYSCFYIVADGEMYRTMNREQKQRALLVQPRQFFPEVWLFEDLKLELVWFGQEF